jgi:hypothetical protein
MARRRKSSTRRRKKKTKAQRRRIALRNLAKAHRARRRKGGKKRRRNKKSRKRGGRRSRRRSSTRRGLSFKAQQVYQRLIDRGRTPQQAHKVASRIDRMRTGRVKRYFEREAMQAKTSAQLGNLFSGFGAAGHLAAQVK